MNTSTKPRASGGRVSGSCIQASARVPDGEVDLQAQLAELLLQLLQEPLEVDALDQSGAGVDQLHQAYPL